LKTLRWKLLLEKKDTIIFKLETKVEHLSLIQVNDAVQMEQLNLVIKQQNKQIKRGKLERWFFGGGLLVLTGILIAK
jgi:hypothetical protein